MKFQIIATLSTFLMLLTFVLCEEEKGEGKGEGPGKGPGKGRKGGHGGRGGMMMMHHYTKAVVCGDEEITKCVSSIASFPKIKEAMSTVEVPADVKARICPTKDQMKTEWDTRKKLGDSIKDIMKENKMKPEEMKPFHECLKKNFKGKGGGPPPEE